MCNAIDNVRLIPNDISVTKRYYVLRFILVLLAISCVLVLLKYNTLNAPFHWDVMGFAVPTAENIYHNGILIAGTGSTGHPPLFAAVLALTWKIFGKTLLVSHFMNLLFGALGLTCLFFLAHRLYGLKVAVTAALLLLFNQTFFTQVGIVYLSIPLMSLAVLTVFAYIRRTYWLYFVAATAMLLVKETSLIVLGSILIYEIFVCVSEKRKIVTIVKRTIGLSLPVVPLAAWSMVHFLMVGYVFTPGRVFLNRGDLFSTFFRNFTKHFIYDASIENFNRANWILLLIIVFSLVAAAKRKLAYEKLFFLIIVLNVIFFSITDDLPRYFLVTFPFFILAGARASVALAEKARFSGRIFLLPAFILLYVGFSVMNYNGTRQTDGWRLESNMEYLDMIRLDRTVCQFLQQELASASILTNGPLKIALRKPWYGYVDRPLSVTNELPPKKIKGTIVVWSAQSNYGPFAIFVSRNRPRLELVREFSDRGKRVEIFRIMKKQQKVSRNQERSE